MSVLTYSIAIRTLGTSGDKFIKELRSIVSQTVQPEKVVVYIAEGYSRPEVTVGKEEYVWVKKGMMTQRALPYDEISSDCILMLDDDVRLAGSVQIGHHSADGALARQRLPLAVEVVDVAGGRLVVILAVGEDQRKIAIMAQIVLVDALQHAVFGDVEVLSSVSKRPLAECVKTFGDPLFHRLSPCGQGKGLTDCEKHKQKS